MLLVVVIFLKKNNMRVFLLSAVEFSENRGKGQIEMKVETPMMSWHHREGVLSIDWDRGIRIATAGADNSIRVFHFIPFSSSFRLIPFSNGIRYGPTEVQTH